MLSDQHLFSVPVSVVSLSMLLVTVTISFIFLWGMVITTPNLQPGGPEGGSLFVWSLPFDLWGGPTRSTRLHVKLATPFRAESLSMLIIFILLLFLIDTRIFSEKAKLQYLSSKSEICQQYNGNHNTVSILTNFFCVMIVICVPEAKFGFVINVLNWNT